MSTPPPPSLQTVTALPQQYLLINLSALCPPRYVPVPAFGVPAARAKSSRAWRTCNHRPRWTGAHCSGIVPALLSMYWQGSCIVSTLYWHCIGAVMVYPLPELIQDGLCVHAAIDPAGQVRHCCSDVVSELCCYCIGIAVALLRCCAGVPAARTDPSRVWCTCSYRPRGADATLS